MKDHIKALITAATVLAVAATMTVSCLAFDNTSNTQTMNELQARADAYYEKVGGATTDAETNTYNAVKIYIDRIDVLRQATDRDTASEMALEGKRGVATGILSWIYFSHEEDIKALTSSDAAAISEVYYEQRDVIDRAEHDFFEGNGVTACYTRLLVQIYSRKIEGLRVCDNGNQLVNKIVDLSQKQVMSRCAYSESFGEDAENCRIYYAEVEARVRLQTLRDNAIEQLRAAAERVCSDRFDMSEDGRYARFFSSLNNSELEASYIDGEIGDSEVASVFNRALLDALTELLELPQTDGEYKRAYHELLCHSVSDRVSACEAETPIPQVAVEDLFFSYPLGLSQAEAKDALSLYADSLGRDSTMNIVILEYTGATDRAGIFDNTSDIAQVEETLTGAKMRCVWYDTYRMSLVRIAEYLGEGSDKAREAKVLYYAVDGKIKAGERPSEENILENLATDITEMGRVVDRAEAERFTLDHRDIIEKSDIKLSDKAALIEAISGSESLSRGALEFLSDTLASLAGKYKELTVGEIASHLTEDGARELRRNAIYRLTTLVNALSHSNNAGDNRLCEMMHLSDNYLEKSKSIKAILDSYNDDYLELGNKHFGKETEYGVLASVEEIIATKDGDEREKAAACILKIKRATALEHIWSAAEGYEEIGSIPQILSVAANELDVCLTDTDIWSYREEKTAHIREIIRVYELNSASDNIKDRVDRITKKIDAYLYIDGEGKAELYSALEAFNTEALELLAAASDGQGVRDTLSALQQRLTELEVSADFAELSACLSYVRSQMSEALGKREYYTEENYIRAETLFNGFEQELSEAGSIEEYLDILRRAIAEIGEVEDLLDTAKRQGEEKLSALYETLRERSYCYSADRLATLEEIYTHSVSELRALNVEPTEYQKAHELVEARMKLMREVRLQVIYTPDGILVTQKDNPQYPDGYSISENGFAGSLWSESGFSSETELVIKITGVGDINGIIKRAVRNKNVLAGGVAASRDILKALKIGAVTLGLDVGDILAEGGKYRLSLLLPAEYDPTEILGVVAIRGDGEIEFFYPETEGALLSFETDSYSKFYLVKKGSVDLLPLIICLSIIVVCELCILALLIIRRRKYRETLLGIAPAPFLLATAYRPAGGNIIVVALAVTAAGLLGAISYLVYLELGAASKKKEGEESIEKKKNALISVSADREVVSKNRQVENRETPQENMRERVEAISVSAAERLMSDSEARLLQKKSNEEYEDTEIYHGERKSEINIDVISQSFSDGDTVTLNSLKEKGLIPQSAGRVKILARGVLDKRLRVVAQDFSDAAVKMILLTGGEAIVTYSASEQNKNRKNSRFD